MSFYSGVSWKLLKYDKPHLLETYPKWQFIVYLKIATKTYIETFRVILTEPNWFYFHFVLVKQLLSLANEYAIYLCLIGFKGYAIKKWGDFCFRKSGNPQNENQYFSTFQIHKETCCRHGSFGIWNVEKYSFSRRKFHFF